MITLNDYLYSGDTVLRILKKYIADLRISAVQKHNEVDLVHCNFLIQIMKLLEHNDFLTSQSQKIREFYKYMAQEYPYLSFTFKGRIKSLIRAEGKFNGYIVEYIYDYYEKNGSYPSVSEIKERLNCFRDLIAYRIVISMPRCHMKQKQDRKKEEIRYLYRIANVLPQFLEERGFTAEPTGGVKRSNSLLLDDVVRPYYRDYIDGESTNSYRSLHITFFDNSARCYMEMQLRTKEMDDIAEIGVANHLFYEKKQETSRGRRDAILQGGCIYFDEAYERCRLLQDLDLSGVDVNMFTAVNNSLMNDGCGLFRGRLILPYEHLSKFQNDIAEIGVANHLFYEKKQETSRGRRDAILQGGCIYFDEAYERCRLLQDLDLSGVDVNMFTAVNNSLMNDGCGLFRGRLILPYEHLSKFQNDMID